MELYVSNHIATSKFEDSLLIYPCESSKFIVLNKTSKDIFEYINSHGTTDGLLEYLSNKYLVSTEQFDNEVSNVILSLIEKGILIGK